LLDLGREPASFCNDSIRSRRIDSGQLKGEDMKNIYYTVGFVLLTLFAGCSTGTNTNTAYNSNRASGNSTLGNAANTVANSMSNAANTVSNAVSSATTTSDPDFVKEAAMGGMAEVELGKVASTKATNPEVKKFAQMMVTDHSKANEELKALATKKGIALPAELDSSHKSMLDDFKGKAAASFDKDYVDDMVDDHEKDVAAFENKAKNATDPDIKAFAEKTLPTLRKHLEAIKALHSKL
jgi:putative membrane protein